MFQWKVLTRVEYPCPGMRAMVADIRLRLTRNIFTTVVVTLLTIKYPFL